MARITLAPPPGTAVPYRRIRLASGRIVYPDFEKNGRVLVENETEAMDLQCEGWTRVPTMTKRATLGDVARRASSFAEFVKLAKQSPTSAAAFAGSFGYLADMQASLADIETLVAEIAERQDCARMPAIATRAPPAAKSYRDAGSAELAGLAKQNPKLATALSEVFDRFAAVHESLDNIENMLAKIAAPRGYSFRRPKAPRPDANLSIAELAKIAQPLAGSPVNGARVVEKTADDLQGDEIGDIAKLGPMLQTRRLNR